MTISHLTTFYLLDENDWKLESAKVFVSLAADGYEIKFRSKFHTWDAFVLLEARDEIEAGDMIVAALSHSERRAPRM